MNRYKGLRVCQVAYLLRRSRENAAQGEEYVVAALAYNVVVTAHDEEALARRAV
jgi:hypothetical protein